MEALAEKNGGDWQKAGEELVSSHLEAVNRKQSDGADRHCGPRPGVPMQAFLEERMSKEAVPKKQNTFRKQISFARGISLEGAMRQGEGRGRSSMQVEDDDELTLCDRTAVKFSRRSHPADPPGILEMDVQPEALDVLEMIKRRGPSNVLDLCKRLRESKDSEDRLDEFQVFCILEVFVRKGCLAWS